MPALVRAALAFLAGLAILFPGAGSAGATGTGLQVHHLLPEDGAVLAAAPDHVEVMFDQDLQPGASTSGSRPTTPAAWSTSPRPDRRRAGGRPAATGTGPGHYTVGVQVLDRTGHLARGTFGFTVDPAVVRAAGPGGSGTDGSGSSDDAAWIVPAAATALLLPAALLALRRRRRR